MGIDLSNKITFLIGFPVVITGMLFVSALLGYKWQGAWKDSRLYKIILNSPTYTRLLSAVLVGAITPFCSCTTIPALVAILEAKLGLDVAMAFLIASPTLDPAGLLLLLGLVGPKLTLIYALSCVVTALLGGWLLGKFFDYRHVNPWLSLIITEDDELLTWRKAAQEAARLVGRLWWVIVLSSIVGMLINDYVPDSMLRMIGDGGFLAVPLAAVIGAMVYAHMAVVIPLGATLLAKGLAPGIVLTFLVSAAGISPPEIILLRKIISKELLLAYLMVTLALFTFIGYLVNFIGG